MSRWEFGWHTWEYIPSAGLMQTLFGEKTGGVASPQRAAAHEDEVGFGKATHHQCRVMAGSVSSRALLTADLGRPGPRIESRLPGAASYSHCRPVRERSSAAGRRSAIYRGPVVGRARGRQPSTHCSLPQLALEQRRGAGGLPGARLRHPLRAQRDLLSARRRDRRDPRVTVDKRRTSGDIEKVSWLGRQVRRWL